MLNYQVYVEVREDGHALVYKKFEVHDPALITDSERKAARVTELEAAIAVLNGELAKNLEAPDAALPGLETHEGSGGSGNPGATAGPAAPGTGSPAGSPPA